MIFFRYLLFIFITLASQPIFAGQIEVEDPSGGLLPNAEKDPTDVIGSIIAYGIGITGVLAIMAITWAAIQMVLAAGDEEKVKKARYMMIYAFIGVVVAGLAYGTVTFVMNLQLDTFSN